MRTAIARFKELCLDTSVDPAAAGELGRFWAAAIGVDFVPGGAEGEPGDLVGAEEGMGIALCPVPEPKTAKHRVHLDVSTASVAELAGRGASVLREPDQEISWTVLADPEGGEFCAFTRPAEQLPDYRLFEVVVDSADPEAAARWWGAAFGVEARNDGKPWWWIEKAPGFPAEVPWWGMVFVPVPEPKTVKNRIHWDLYGQVSDFVARGATVLWEMPRWTVLADPEGNEFCVFEPPR